MESLYVTKDKYKIINNPHVLKFFDHENNDASYLHLSIWEKTKIRWKCEKGHSFTCRPEKIHLGQECPYCYGRYATQEDNLQIKNHQLASEWDYYKNKLSPADVKERSGKKVWWKCNKGHSWKASPHNRATGQGCPYCTNKKTDKNNSFQNDKGYKHILKEWNYDKNKIHPTEITSGYSKKVWWKCNNGHEWEASVRQRCIKATSCPFCKKIVFKSGETFDSYAEALYFLELKEQKIKFIQRKKYPKSRLISDFYIPSLNKFIEITSFRSQKGYIFGDKFFWRKYLKKIAKKKKISTSAGYYFEFVQRKLSGKEIFKVRKFMAN